MIEPAPGPPADRESLVDLLSTLGMGPDEAKVYLRLSTSGPQKAGALAKLLEWSRPEMYRVLQRLVEQGYVDAALTRPVEFRAVPVAVLFERLERLQQDRLARLGASKDAVEGLVTRLQARASPGEEAGFRLMHGRTVVLATAERMIAEARRSAFVACTSPLALNLLGLAGVVHTAERRAKEGLQVRWVAGASTSSMPLPSLPGGVRIAPLAASAALILADDEHALCWLKAASSPRLHEESESALWTNAADFVATQATACEMLWERSAPR